MVAPRDSKLWLLLLLFLAAFLLRLYVFVNVGYSADDALITFRYARNLAAGNGFVYNTGQQVLGTTTPLFTLLIAAFFKCGISPFMGAFLLNALADLLTAFVLWRMFASLKPPLGWIPAALFLFSPETLQWSLSGMETEFSIGCLFAAFWFAARDSWKGAFFAGALATLIRIDGAAVLVALTAGHVLRRGRLPAVPLAVAVLTVLPWSLFAFHYFGSPVPNSAAAKWALSGRHWLPAAATILFDGFLHLRSAGIVLLIPAIAGTRELVRGKREWLPLVIWTWGYALSYALAAGPMHPWYYAPFYAGYLPLVWAGCVALTPRVPLRSAAPVLGGIAICIVLYLSYVRFDAMRRDQEGVNTLNGGVGRWLASNTPAGSVVALKDIGFSGYYSQRTVLDLAGLVSPECVPYRVHGDFLGPIRAFQPRYFAFSEGQLRNLDLEGSDLLQLYKKATEIRQGGGAYIIFELR